MFPGPSPPRRALCYFTRHPRAFISPVYFTRPAPRPSGTGRLPDPALAETSACPGTGSFPARLDLSLPTGLTTIRLLHLQEES